MIRIPSKRLAAFPFPFLFFNKIEVFHVELVCCRGSANPLGPFTTQQILSGLLAGQYNEATIVSRDGFADWQPAGRGTGPLPALAGNVLCPPALFRRRSAMKSNSHHFRRRDAGLSEIRARFAGKRYFRGSGHDVHARSVVMETVFGDASRSSSSGTFFNKMLGAGKRLITARGCSHHVHLHRSGQGQGCLCLPLSGRSFAFDLTKYNGRIICQKDVFLCAAKGVAVGIAFQKKIGAGSSAARGSSCSNSKGTA